MQEIDSEISHIGKPCNHLSLLLIKTENKTHSTYKKNNQTGTIEIKKERQIAKSVPSLSEILPRTEQISFQAE